MTVVHLIANLKSGGAQSILERLVAGSRLSQVVVSMGEVGEVGRRMVQRGIPIHTLAMHQPWLAPLALYRLVRLLRRLQPEVLQTWLYPADLLGTLAGSLAGVDHIYWNIRATLVQVERRSDHHYWLPRLLAPGAGWVDGVVVNSRQGLREHQQIGYHPRHWHLIGNAVDLQQFCPDDRARAAWRQRLSLPRNTVLVGMVARHHPMKGHGVFVAAAQRLAAQWPEVRFVLAGRGVTADTLGLQGVAWADRFHVLGEVGDVPGLMAALDFLVSASLSGEGFANVLGEAMACGLPCVATRCGDAADILPEEGILVAAGDPWALQAGMEQCLALGAEGRQRLGALGRQRMAERFSLEAMVARYEALYRQGASG